MRLSWVKTDILLPNDYSDEDTLSVAEEILNYIVERTKSGKDSDGKPFVKYSKSYMNSLDFKIAGKTSKVNLTLSSEMLDSLEILKASKGKITIGFPKDSDMNGRAEGNILGSYGGSANSAKARDFMGFSNKELSTLIRGLDVLPREIQNEISKAAKAGAIEILDKSKYDIDEDE